MSRTNPVPEMALKFNSSLDNYERLKSLVDEMTTNILFFSRRTCSNAARPRTRPSLPCPDPAPGSFWRCSASRTTAVASASTTSGARSRRPNSRCQKLSKETDKEVKAEAGDNFFLPRPFEFFAPKRVSLLI